jgi:hypothetical protein
MAKSYIVDSTATQVVSGACRKVLITVNAALTGNIKVIDGISGSTANVGTITNPTVGSRFEYWDFTSGVRIIASTTCDITVSADGSYGPK